MWVGSVLRASISGLEPLSGHKGFNMPMSGLEEMERDHILRALEFDLLCHTFSHVVYFSYANDTLI